MSDWDPFKPVDLGKKKDENSFFEPVSAVNKESKTYWGYSSDKTETSWAFSTGSSKSDNGTWGWGPGGDDSKKSSWAFSTGDDKKSDGFWSSGTNKSDSLGFGSESTLMSLKAREDAFKSNKDWNNADTNWA